MMLSRSDEADHLYLGYIIFIMIVIVKQIID